MKGSIFWVLFKQWQTHKSVQDVFQWLFDTANPETSHVRQL